MDQSFGGPFSFATRIGEKLIAWKGSSDHAGLGQAEPVFVWKFR